MFDAFEVVRTYGGEVEDPPQLSEVISSAKERGMQSVSFELAHDARALAGGGRVLADPFVVREVKKEAWQRASVWKKFGSVLTLSGAPVGLSLVYNRTIAALLRKIKVEELPGDTILERAVALILLLQRAQEQQPSVKTLAKQADGLADRINSSSEMVHGMGSDQRSLAQKFLASESGDSDNEKRQNDELAMVEQSVADPKFHDLLAAHKLCSTLPQFATVKTRQWKKHPRGRERVRRHTRELSDVSLLAESAFTMAAVSKELFVFDVLTGNHRVEERVNYFDEYSLLYTILDCTQSLRMSSRRFKAVGVVLNRLHEVVTGKARMYLSRFDTALREEIQIFDRKSAEKMMTQMGVEAFDSSDTNIDASIRSAIERIRVLEKNKSLKRPQLLVITDGESKVVITPSELTGIRLNVVLLESNNDELLALSRATGGVGIKM